MEKLTEMIEKIENEELESEQLPVETYIKLLAAYLYTNQLIEAKHLYKRIPQNIKADNKEIHQLHQLTLALIANSYPQFFESVNYNWSECIKQCMEELIKKVRSDVFDLVGSSYDSITETNLLKLTHYTREQLNEACTALDWKYENYNQQVIIVPKKPPTKPTTCATSEDQLFKLTEFVSFLEN